MKIVTVRFVAPASGLGSVKVGLKMGVQMSLLEDGDDVERWYITDRFLHLGIGSDMSGIVSPQGIIFDAILFFNKQAQCSYFLRECRAPKKIKQDVYVVLPLRAAAEGVVGFKPFSVTPVRNRFRNEEVFGAGEGGQTQIWRLKAGAHLEVRSGHQMWKVCNIGGVVQVCRFDRGQDVIVLKEPEVCNVPPAPVIKPKEKGTGAKLAKGGTGTQALVSATLSVDTVFTTPVQPKKPLSLSELLDERDWLLTRWEEVGARLKELGHNRSRYELRVSSGPDRDPEAVDV